MIFEAFLAHWLLDWQEHRERTMPEILRPDNDAQAKVRECYRMARDQAVVNWWNAATQQKPDAAAGLKADLEMLVKIRDALLVAAATPAPTPKP